VLGAVGGRPRALGRFPGLSQRFRCVAVYELLMRRGGIGDALACLDSSVERPGLLDQLQRDMIGEDFARARELRGEISDGSRQIVERRN
jgi:hypothetical protein